MVNKFLCRFIKYSSSLYKETMNLLFRCYEHVQVCTWEKTTSDLGLFWGTQELLQTGHWYTSPARSAQDQPENRCTGPVCPALRRPHLSTRSDSGSCSRSTASRLCIGSFLGVDRGKVRSTHGGVSFSGTCCYTPPCTTCSEGCFLAYSQPARWIAEEIKDVTVTLTLLDLTFFGRHIYICTWLLATCISLCGGTTVLPHWTVRLELLR